MIKFVNLPMEQALGTSDDLWILSETSSTLFHRIDWLLNFQLTYALQHKTRSLPAKIDDILSKSELKSLDFIESSKSSILLVASFSFLPCQWLILAPYESAANLDKWWESIQTRIASLKCTHIRFFLDEKFPVARLVKLAGNPDLRYSMVAISAQKDADPMAESLKWI